MLPLARTRRGTFATFPTWPLRLLVVLPDAIRSQMSAVWTGSQSVTLAAELVVRQPPNETPVPLGLEL